jgi:hypothetical protein
MPCKRGLVKKFRIELLNGDISGKTALLPSFYFLI